MSLGVGVGLTSGAQGQYSWVGLRGRGGISASARAYGCGLRSQLQLRVKLQVRLAVAFFLCLPAHLPRLRARADCLVLAFCDAGDLYHALRFPTPPATRLPRRRAPRGRARTPAGGARARAA